MGEKDIEGLLKSAKKLTVEASKSIASTATAIAGKTQIAVVQATARIKDDIQNKKAGQSTSTRIRTRNRSC